MTPGAESGAGRPGPRDLAASEVLALVKDAIAVFDGEAVLCAASPAFAREFAVLGDFTRPGTTWEIFLREAASRGIIPWETCEKLRLTEDRFLDAASSAPEIEWSDDAGTPRTATLTRAGREGFALTVTPGTASGDGDSDVEAIMATVLEACPANLTMARIGDGRILYRTPAAVDLHGTGRNSLEHFAFVEERADFLTALLPEGRVDDMRITGRRPDGKYFPASISARVIEYRGDEVMVSNMVDLSSEIRLQSELALQKEKVFQAEKLAALGELLAGVAHELNNPLSIVVGNTQFLAEDARLNADLRPRVGRIGEAADRCVRIVRTFLSMAREQPLNLESCALADIVARAVEAYRGGAGCAVLRIETNIAAGLPDVRADRVQMVQVVLNILINAEHAITESGIGDSVTLTARTLHEHHQVELRISDNGPGVSEDIALRIFDPLFTTKSGGKGTGIGLAFCHRIVAAHGGALELEGPADDGATFVIRLPVAG